MSPNVSPAQMGYLRQHKRQKIFIKLCQFLILVSFLAIWELAVNAGWIDGFIFSSPSRICRTFYKMCADGSFFLHLGTTLGEVFVSFLLIIIIGYASAVLLWFFPKLSKILEPYFVVLNSLPKSALAPLLIVWLGANIKTIIVAGISVAIFGTILSLYTAFVETDSEDMLLIYTLHGTKRHVLTKVIFPSTLPTFISLMKVNIGLALVGVIIGEFLAARQGLGYLIIYGSQVFRWEYILIQSGIVYENAVRTRNYRVLTETLFYWLLFFQLKSNSICQINRHRILFIFNSVITVISSAVHKEIQYFHLPFCHYRIK